MKKCLVVVGLSIFSSTAMSSMYIYHPIGSSTTLGDYGNRHALSTASGNAASPYLMANLQGFRVSFLGPVGIALEGGGINGINDRIDELTDIVDRDFTSGIDLDAIAEKSSSVSDANSYALSEVSSLLNDIDSTVAGVNEVINNIADTTYVKLAATAHAPFMPIIYKTRRRGVFVIDSSASLVGRAGILADEVTLTGLDELRNITTATELDDIDLEGVDVETDLSIHLKRASDLRFGVGYSEMVYRSKDSAFIIGGRVNLHKMSLAQKLTVLTEDGSEEVEYGDFFTGRDSIQSDFSLDLGVVWAAQNYQLGASITNINEPTFDYEAIGDCTGLSGSDLVDCNAAVSFASEGKLLLEDSYTMEAQMTLDAAIKSKDQHFSLAGSYDVNSIEDPLGDEYQWAVASLSYFSDNFILPGIRVGYRKNLVGSELDYITGGLTFYRRLDIDVSYAPENEEGNTGASLSVGYSFVF